MSDMSPEQIHRVTLALARENFEFFATMAYRLLHDEPYLHNWHVAAIAHQLMRLTHGDIRRLLITMPPRTLKSFLTSVCWPAWLLGRDPGEKIIVASYAQPLSNEFAFQMRRLMESAWYGQVFPHARIDRHKAALEEIKTTRGGYRLSTSVGGALTGRGGNIIIIDDPIKAADAHSEQIRQSVEAWYSGTVTSRFNNPRHGKIVVVAQRLHMNDLPGMLAATRQWHHLNLPLIAPREERVEVDAKRDWVRQAGEVLHPARFSKSAIANLKAAMSKDDFEAQYNQRPLPLGGAVFKLEWLKRFDQRPYPHHIQGIFQSWDTAYETSGQNDFSVCSTWALCDKKFYLLDVFRARLAFPDLEQAVHKLRNRWKADLVLVEAAGSGISLFQNISRVPGTYWIKTVKPIGSKQDRASMQSSKFARGMVYVPADAPWLRAFEDELASFPQGKHDDQVDSVVQFLAAVDSGKLLALADVARQF